MWSNRGNGCNRMVEGNFLSLELVPEPAEGRGES